MPHSDGILLKDWIATAKHPTTGKRFIDMTYQPMLEVLAYLRANGFKNFIVSGGGIEFMRPWAEAAYGIPPEQVVGSSVKTKFELRDGQPVIVRLPELNFNDDKGGKPVGINQHIGRQPIAAFGNSDGDLQMLQHTGAGGGTRFCLYVHHDDAGREYAYDRTDHLAKLDKGLDEAAAKGWTVVSMKNDWKTVFPIAQSEITAIDILLQPDATMLKHAAANNARLLKAYPKGFALDATHTPHITLLQCFVRTADLEQLYAAEEKVFTAANVNAMTLEAFKFYYAPAAATGVAGICAKPTPATLKLQALPPRSRSWWNAAPSEPSLPPMTIPPSTRPSSNMCQHSCRRCPARTSIRTSAPASPPKITSTRCSPNRLRTSRSRSPARPSTSLARSARPRRNSKPGI